MPQVNGCYHLVTERKQWFNAQLHCKRHHKAAHLAFIEDAHEQAAIAYLLTSFSGRYVTRHFHCRFGCEII